MTQNDLPLVSESTASPVELQKFLDQDYFILDLRDHSEIESE